MRTPARLSVHPHSLDLHSFHSPGPIVADIRVIPRVQSVQTLSNLAVSRGLEVAGSARCNQRVTSARRSGRVITRVSHGTTVSGSDLSIVSIPRSGTVGPRLGDDQCVPGPFTVPENTELDRRRDQEDDLGARR